MDTYYTRINITRIHIISYDYFKYFANFLATIMITIYNN